MDFEELLQALHAIVGEEVMVSVAPIGADPPVPVVALSGELRKAESAPSQEILERMGRAQPGDEAYIVHVGGTDEPAEKNYLLISKRDYLGAEWEEGPFGERVLGLQLQGLSVNIVQREDAERHVPRSEP